MSLEKINNQKQVFILAFILIIMTGCSIQDGQVPDTDGDTVLMKTSEGDIRLRLFSEESPETVQNFKSYVEEGFYNKTVFHRVIDGFMAQGGGFTSDGNQKETREPVDYEGDNGLKNRKGTVAMARTNQPDSATSQFFINLDDNDFLNHVNGTPGYVVFGEVIQGMDIVDRIGSTSTGFRYGMADWPDEDIIIEGVILEE